MINVSHVPSERRLLSLPPWAQTVWILTYCKVNAVTEEEQRSFAMPDDPQLRCDACSIIAQNLAGALLHTEALRERPLSEFQYESAIEQVCKEGLDEYTTRRVMGLNGEGKTRLNGPGSEASRLKGAIIQGGYWAARMQSACRSVVGEIEEEQIYAKFKKFVDAPKRKLTKQNEAGVQAFVKDICLHKEDEAQGNKKKKKKQKQQSRQTIHSSCSEELFFFGEEEWKAVLDLRKRMQHKIEL
eukprot:gnl/MRDRNA2_/MRDRNA2_15913_c0_seq1.p1 gnl/MRDRNA2_/MRDRNA2_15913_c0~~gnl/MRDRNA2_/MRDRNA2_15913_c0_seq1.p1  ORF type:complete len:242 (-),score=61.31 gnl/MRDRNA2_/MRDRNA2_15913_c0_seq1:202-927(-)